MTLEELAEAFPGADGENLAMALDLLRPFGALVSVRCGDQELRLPERNNLWRGLQFWGLVTGRLTIDFTRFCLAGNCEQCATKIARSGGAPEMVLACQTEPEPGLEILELAEGFRLQREQNGPTGGSMSRRAGLILSRLIPSCLIALSLTAAEPMPAPFVKLKTSAGSVEKGGRIAIRPGERMTLEAKVYGGRRAWCMEPEKYANAGKNTVIETKGEDGLSFTTGPGFRGVWKLESETAAWYGQLGDLLKPDAGRNTATLTGPKNPGSYVLSVKTASSWHYDRFSQGNHVQQTEKHEAEATFTVVVEAVAGSWFSSANIVATGQPDDDLRFRLQNVQVLYDSVSQQLLDRKWTLARQGLGSLKATLGNIRTRLDQLKREKPGYACEITFLGLPSDKVMQRLQALQTMTEQWKAMNLIASGNAQKINQLLLNKQTVFSNNILKSVFKNYIDWGSGIPGPNDLFGAVPAQLQGLVIPSNILDWYTNAQEDASILKNQAQTIQQLSKLREFYLSRLKSFNQENRAIHDEIKAHEPARDLDAQAKATLSGTGFASWQPKR